MRYTNITGLFRVFVGILFSLTFPVANVQCKNGSKQREELAESIGIIDVKGCILWRLRAILVDGEKMNFFYEEGRGLRRALLVVFSGLFQQKYTRAQNLQRKDIVEKLLKRSSPCAKILKNVSDARLPSTEWTPFYDCIAKAWEC